MERFMEMKRRVLAAASAFLAICVFMACADSGSVTSEDSTVDATTEATMNRAADAIAPPIASETVPGNFIPLWMQPDTVIVYYDDVNVYTIIAGGELSEEEIAGREDISSIGLINTEPGFRVEPYTRIEYDLHGFYKNTYYLVPIPGEDGAYDADYFQLSPPESNGENISGLTVGFP